MTFSVRYAQVDPQRIQNRLCRNPAYNNQHVGLNGWCVLPLMEARKHELQKTLEQDIKEFGFRNPIVVYALPEGLFLVFGGSRLRAAHALQSKSIPCIVNDYTGEFRFKEQVTEENVSKFFTDQPCWYEFGEYGYDSHFGLERMRRKEWGSSSAGLDWLKSNRYDKSFLLEEMPWLEESGIIMDDTPKVSDR
jgi:hypothetical protein